MTSDGNSFNDFPEIVQTRQNNHKQNREGFLFLIRGCTAYFLNGPNAAASIAPILI